MTKHYALIGNPLSHSFSRDYFTEKFTRNNINAEYELLQLDSLKDLKQLIQTKQLSGFNVTIPYKVSIIDSLDELDETAHKVGAVNAVKVIPGETLKLKGYNTDVYGFHRSIKPFLTLKHSHALILGTGGASKAAAYVFDKLGINYLFVTSSQGKKAHNIIGYEDVNENILNHFKMLVNATPVGMHPNVEAAPVLPYHYLNEDHFLFDMVYNPAKSRFLLEGEKNNALTLNGLDMLYHQAEKAWEIWNDEEQ
jgi:shikimate dehydrogenase